MGQRIKRREDPRLVRGLGEFVDDILLPGMLHLAFKRSDIAHGRIVSIDTSAAAAMDGVACVLTGDEFRALGIGALPLLMPMPAAEHFAVTPDVARHVGDALAVVVAETRAIARDAVAAIEIEFEPLPAVVDPERAFEGNPVVIHPQFANNRAFHLPAGTGVDRRAGTVDDAAWEAILAEADVVVRQRMESQRLAPTCMEGRGIVAQWDEGQQLMTVWGSTQIPHDLRDFLAKMLGLGQDQVRAIAPDVGGGFGAKKVHPEDIVVAALARHLKRPVKWTEDRSEAFMLTPHGRGIIGYVELAAKRDGRVLGLNARLLADIGAYQTRSTAFIPTMTQGMLSSVYAFPFVRSDLHEVYTNKISTDAYRGAGRPEGIYFVERAMDMLARELDLDPAELRRRNFIRPDQFPFLTQAGNRYDSGAYESTMDQALSVANWEGLKAQRDAMGAEGRVVGLGLTMYVEICAGGGWEHGSVTVQRDGRIVATLGSTTQGQGHKTTFAQLLADQFGIPMEHVTIVQGDTAAVRAGIGTFGSRSQVIGGTALLNAANEVKAKARQFASQMLDAAPEDIVFENGLVGVRGSPGSGVPLASLAAYAYTGRGRAGGRGWPEGLTPGLSAEAFWEPENATFPFGCHISMVEIDRETGELTLLKMLCVDDAGTIINPLIVEGQVHGGLAQGIGQALLEGVVYDDDGQLISGSFMDYAMPRATDFPRFELHSTVTPSPFSPLGTKGIGEAGTIGSAPCLVNAAVDALSVFGVKHVDMPLWPEKLWALINSDPHSPGGQP
ncbi:hypothetical protein AYO38_10320 [bacterium SCGC AG-212-C10]|nr:hypothetical protein AYO38_10320 [bacterium SCGC AG-212-C10]